MSENGVRGPFEHADGCPDQAEGKLTDRCTCGQWEAVQRLLGAVTGQDGLRDEIAAALMDARDERDEQQRQTCPKGCGCRYMSEDPDRRDCACDGPCCMDEAWWDGREYDEVLADAVLAKVQARIDAAREQVAEQIAQAIEVRAKDGTWNVGGQVVLEIAAGIAREHAKGDSDE